MQIRQFEDKNLSHYSYAIISDGSMVLIDPSRNPETYYQFAREENAMIVAVIETHPHADFISSHLEMHKTTGAIIYTSRLVQALYPHETFDDGENIRVGEITLEAMNTPGHSPDSISILLKDKEGVTKAVFTGDTLFIGDCGRPDLREQPGVASTARTELARHMYHSLRDKYLPLPDHVIVYPAHGAGSLCGRSLSRENSSTMGNEKITNWSLQKMSEDEFVKELLKDQPFIPKYFSFDVQLNKSGADDFAASIEVVKREAPILQVEDLLRINKDILIIDSRSHQKFNKQHLRKSINLMDGKKFETWLGSIVYPGEPFYLAGSHEADLENLLARIAKIGYEKQVEATFVLDYGDEEVQPFDSDALKDNADDYTIVDVRNQSEVDMHEIFDGTIHIPLHELRERTNEIPRDKPVVVHCEGGYRSAAGSTVIRSSLGGNTEVYDLGNDIKKFIR